MKKILVLNLFIFSVLVLNAQTDTVKMKRNNAILLNKKGLEFYNQKDYKNAIDCFTKAIIADSSFGDPFYNRAKSIINLNPNEFIDFEIRKIRRLRSGRIPKTNLLHYYFKFKQYI